MLRANCRHSRHSTDTRSGLVCRFNCCLFSITYSKSRQTDSYLRACACVCSLFFGSLALIKNKMLCAYVYYMCRFVRKLNKLLFLLGKFADRLLIMLCQVLSGLSGFKKEVLL